MTGKRPLSQTQVQESMGSVPLWSLEGDALLRVFVFRDFVEAFGFMTRVALIAEKMNHHPDWSNVWKTVRVRLSTHEAGALTALDFALARAMDGLLSE